jgi:hypothetical protein
MSDLAEGVLPLAGEIIDDAVPYDVTKDNVPGLVLGIQAIVGTAWWIIGMLTYIKNVSSDSNLKTISGVDIYPIGWWWERLSEAAEVEEETPKYLWISVSLLT